MWICKHIHPRFWPAWSFDYTRMLSDTSELISALIFCLLDLSVSKSETLIPPSLRRLIYISFIFTMVSNIGVCIALRMAKQHLAVVHTFNPALRKQRHDTGKPCLTPHTHTPHQKNCYASLDNLSLTLIMYFVLKSALCDIVIATAACFWLVFGVSHSFMVLYV